jgi:hypothetical protein
MHMDDKDWLDQRLEAGTYIPDDGFTARVVTRLPKRESRAVIVRRQILFLSTFLAVCLGAVQVIPLVRQMEALAGQYSLGHLVDLGTAYLHQPLGLAIAAGIAIAASLALVPLLRRWV